ncbi:MAG: hypothetical protein DCC57_00010 [Chloroflexi bacterium]|nr:MAG: hypothetical protein DCC57_00010 [Chloroflexota bacterium]
MRLVGAALFALLLGLGACAAPPVTPAAGSEAAAATVSGAPAGLELTALQNATYTGIYDKPVPLHDGRYEGEPFVAGGASRPTVTLAANAVAYGDLTGDGVDEAAVILAESSGGSGTFIYLAAVGLAEGAPHNLATALLGDRVQVEGLAIADEQITFQVLRAGPRAPDCCREEAPTQQWALEGDALVLVAGEPISQASK